MAYYLFGSRSPAASHMPKRSSDIDVFVETLEEAAALPSEWLIGNGGPVDAFSMPGGDGWALPVTEDPDDDRMLMCSCKSGLLVDPVEISFKALCLLVEAVSLSWA